MTVKELNVSDKFKVYNRWYRKMGTDLGLTHLCHDLAAKKLVKLRKDLEVEKIDEPEPVGSVPMYGYSTPTS